MTNTENNSQFKNAFNSQIAKTWVAISTNIWIKYKQKAEITSTIYKEIFSISEVLSNNTKANQEIIWYNMLQIEEYRNLLKTNIKELLDSSYDKSSILNAIIDQLEYRYVKASENAKLLLEQRNIFEWTMNSSNTKIETLKSKISTDFKNNNSDWSLENINQYLSLKQEYYYAKTYIVYINHFLSEYSYLNEYNKKLLDTLINNKDALIKDSFVVIPDSWTELLRNFDLLYSEEEFKAN